MTAALSLLSTAETIASAAIDSSAQKNGSTYLPYCAEMAAFLDNAANHVRTYEDIAGVERHEYQGESADGYWRVVLSVPAAPQAARFR
jgi:hypothetical protein